MATAVAERKRPTLALAASGSAAVVAAVVFQVRAAGTMPPLMLAAWGTAFVLAATIAAAVRRGGWFHPLALPLGAVAVMSFGAPLWVQFTHEPAGLLYDVGHAPPALPLAAVMSGRAGAALALTLVGYAAGALAAQAVIRRPAAMHPQFRWGGIRRAGSRLMVAAALAQALVAILHRGSPYGAGQLQYGVAPLLGSAAAVAVLSGLVIVTLAAPQAGKPARLRDLLSGTEWAALLAFLSAVAVSGDRGGLIAPAVYIAWAYGTKVRPLRLRWLITALAAALVIASVIAGYRDGTGLSPGSPAAVLQGAAGDVNSPAWLMQQTVQRVPSTSPYLHGSTYLAAAEAQLPGPLARRTGATSRTASGQFRNLIGFTDPNQGFAESYPSEAYLNAGLPGCLLAGVFFGALMGWAWRKHGAVPVRARDVLYPVLLAGLVYGFRSDALTQVKDVLYPMLAVWVMMGWYRLRQPTDTARSSCTSC